MNTSKDISPADQAKWQVPAMETPLWLGKQHRYCIVIPVINEGERIKSLLKRMEAERISSIADIIIVDGGSTDGSLELDSLRQVGVRGLVVKKGPGKLSAQLRCAYAFALDLGYEGIVTIDGNDKDDPEAIPRFIEALEGGVDFVQASRFLPGGVAVNTPKSRDFAIRYIHAPCLSVASGFKWTDTTQGFRAYSRRLLLDPKIAPFRDVFMTYELLAYLSYRVPKLGYACKELPTVRRYPAGEAPTKISGFKGNFSVLNILINACLGGFNPKDRSAKLIMTDAIKDKYQIPFRALFLLIFVLIFSSFRFYSGPGSNGNVEQWINLTNQMFYGHQDFLFSYGPLYWITGGATSQYSEVTYWTAILFLSAFFAFYWAAVVWMASEARSIVFLSVVFLVFFQSLIFPNALYLWPFILVVYLDLHRKNEPSRKEYLMYGALVALALYIRFFYGIVALATLGAYLASLGLANRNFRGIIFLSLGLAFSYIIIGLFIFHDYSSIINYLSINDQLSFGNSVDMTIDVINKPQTWVAVAVSALALSLYAFIKKRQLSLTIVILILIFLKMGFSRTDHYLDHFVEPLAVLTLLPLLDRSIFGRGAAIISAACLFYLSTSPSYPGAPVKSAIQQGVNFHVDYGNRMQEVYKDFRLSPDLLNDIGSSSIDIYPYNNEYAFANKLNYKHRPIFQSYMTLTPKLDAMNQAFFESSSRPQFILWTAGFTCDSPKCNPFDSFDGKYTLNEDPLTTSSIFLNYHQVAISQGRGGTPLMLLEQNKSEKKYSEVLIKNEKLEFGKWYNVPIVDNSLLKLKPEFELSVFGKIKNLLFRGDILKVEYKLASGGVKEYRLNILNSRSGIVVSPLLDNFTYTGPRVTQVMFVTSSERYFEPVFDAKWVTISEPPVKITRPYIDTVSDIRPTSQQVKNIDCEGSIDIINGVNLVDRIPDVSGVFAVHGWLAYSTHSGELYDQTYLVITDSKDKKIFISTRMENRGDVSDVFHKEALKNSGYVSIIDASGFNGKSKLGLAGVKDSILYMCNQFDVNLNPVQ